MYSNEEMEEKIKTAIRSRVKQLEKNNIILDELLNSMSYELSSIVGKAKSKIIKIWLRRIEIVEQNSRRCINEITILDNTLRDMRSDGESMYVIEVTG